MIEDETHELKNYRTAVEHYLSSGSSAVFKNSNTSHAAIILQTFLKHATKNVYLFCNKLRKEVYNTPEMLSALNVAMSNNIKIIVLAQHYPESDKFLNAIMHYNNGSIEACHPRQDPITVKREHNFAIMDDKAYRFEPFHETSRAFACMNDPLMASRYSNLFIQMRNSLSGDPFLGF